MPSPAPPGSARVTVGSAVEMLADRFREVFGADARQEARELVSAVFRQPRFWPSVAEQQVLDAESVERLRGAADRRLRGAPLAYAAGNAQFRQLTLDVDERVLIPRPETEYLVDLVLQRVRGSTGGVAVDVGTGSGAIALSLAVEGSFDRVVATDLSADALDVARANARQAPVPPSVTLEWRVGDALAPLHDLALAVDVLVSNPPYIAFAELEQLPALVRDWEPPLALACADDGLAVARAIARGGARLLRPGGVLAIETDTRRARRLAAQVAALDCYAAIRVEHDLTGRERYVLAVSRSPGAPAPSTPNELQS